MYLHRSGSVIVLYFKDGCVLVQNVSVEVSFVVNLVLYVHELKDHSVNKKQ